MTLLSKDSTRSTAAGAHAQTVGAGAGATSQSGTAPATPQAAVGRAWWTAGLLLLALVMAAMLVVRFLITPVGRIDDAIPLMFGRLILDGYRPMVDFHSPYPPLSYYLTAGAMWLVGPSVVADRLVRVLLYGLVLLAFAGYLRRTRGLSWLSVAGWTALFVLLIGDAFWYISFVAASFGTLALMALLHGQQHRGARRAGWVMLSGLLIGLSGLSRSNFGVDFAFAAGALLITLAFWHWREDRGRDATALAPSPARQLLRDSLSLLGPMLLCGAVFLIAYRDAIPTLWEQLVVFPGQLVPHRIRRMRAPAGWIISALPLIWLGLRGGWRPAASASWILGGVLFAGCLTLLSWSESTQPLLPAAAIPGVLLLWAGIAFSRKLDAHEALWLLALGGFLHYYLSRADAVHLAPLLVLGALLLTTLHHDLVVSTLRTRLAAGALVLLVAFAAVPTEAFYVARRTADKSETVAAISLIVSGDLLPKGDAAYLDEDTRIPLHWPQMLLYPDLDELKAVRFLRDRTEPQEAVYVGDISHATLYTASPRTYWLLDRLPAVERFTLEPGVSTEEAEQERMIAAIEAHDVEWIILIDTEHHDEDFARRGYRGSERMDQWLAEHFEPVEQFGRYYILRRR